MAILEDKQSAVRKFGLPTAAGALGAGAGLFLTRKRNLRDALPNLGERGFGDLAEDLRDRVESVLHKADGPGRMKSTSSARGSRGLDPDELERRRHDREQRRNRRRAKS